LREKNHPEIFWLDSNYFISRRYGIELDFNVQGKKKQWHDGNIPDDQKKEGRCLQIVSHLSVS